MTTSDRSFYCNQKFTELSVDVEKRSLQSCCSSRPINIDLDWLTKNPGQLFNTPALIKDRQDMLDNIRTSNCEDSCWAGEDRGLPSRRLVMKSTARTHNKVVLQPTELNISLGSTCNLTCVYCTKFYSSAWYRDIHNNGEYLDQDRFKITAKEQVLNYLSHADIQQSQGYLQILNELKMFESIKTVVISGGEPFLYNHLPATLNNIESDTKISIYTGLGVDSTRLLNQLQKITNRNKILIVVSGENLNQQYDFVRHGNTFEKFKKNIDIIKSLNIEINFRSTVSNLTAFGLVDFADQFAGVNIQYQFCTDPDFLSVNVLDNISKDLLTDTIQKSNIKIKKELLTALAQPCTIEQKSNFVKYIKQFAQRRKLDLHIFPKTFTEWLDTDVV